MKTSVHYFSSENNWDRPLPYDQDSANTLVLIFAAAELEDLLKLEIQKTALGFINSVVMGCSTSGEIFRSHIEDHSLVVAVLTFERTQLRLVHQEIVATDQSRSTGLNIANQLPTEGLKAVFTLTDGLLINGSDYTAGLAENLGNNIIVTGGLAGDGNRFKSTWVLFGNQMREGIAVACGFYGDAIDVRHASRGGWERIGPKRKVTESKANVLYSLDHQPALALYKKYLGDRASGLPATGLLYPLGLHNDDAHDGLTVRTILAVDEAKQSITLAGNIPEGSNVRLMWAPQEQIIQGAADAANALNPMSLSPEQHGLCIAISCVGRRLTLGERTREELDAVMKSLPNGIELVGYYSYGEISPLMSGRCDLHNQSMTLTVFSEYL